MLVCTYLKSLQHKECERSGLRSLSLSLSLSETASYTTPRLRTKFGERAFSFSGPALCNSLPADLRTVSDTSDSKNKLKGRPYWL